MYPCIFLSVQIPAISGQIRGSIPWALVVHLNGQLWLQLGFQLRGEFMQLLQDHRPDLHQIACTLLMASFAPFRDNRCCARSRTVPMISSGRPMSFARRTSAPSMRKHATWCTTSWVSSSTSRVHRLPKTARLRWVDWVSDCVWLTRAIYWLVAISGCLQHHQDVGKYLRRAPQGDDWLFAGTGQHILQARVA